MPKPAVRKNRLTNLRVNEVSLVDNPANPAARVVLAKRAPDVGVEGDDAADDVEKMAGEKLNGGMSSTGSIKPRSAVVNGKCSSCGATAIAGKCPECSLGLKKSADDDDQSDDSGDDDELDGGDVEKVASTFAGNVAGDNLYRYTSALRDSIASILTDADVTDKAGMISTTIGQFTDAVMASVGPALTIADSGATGASGSFGAVGKSGTSTTQHSETDMDNKNTDAAVETAVAKAISGYSEKLEAVTKANADLTAELARRDRVTKAKALIGNAPLDEAMVVELLEKAGETGEAFVAKTVAQLKAATTAGHIFDEIGKSSGTPDNSPESQLTAAANDIITKSAGKLTREQAYGQAIVANPHLYDALVA